MQLHNIFILLSASLAIAQRCSPVHLIVARGSFEAPGEGIAASFSSLIKKQLPGTTSEALEYPAKIPYAGSMEVGVANMKKAIARYTQACPSSKIALVGYSQGGAVTIDTLCGGGDHPEIGPKTPGLTSEEGRNIKVAVSFGEPRFLPGMTYNAGTNTKTGGLYARKRETAQCSNFASLIRSWCDTNDARCASGKSLEVHLQYLNKYSDVAAKFVLEMLRKGDS